MKAFYDLHIHSCLSPCADDDNTPFNIVNMAVLNGLNVIAVTDHNSVRNVRAAISAGEKAGILVVPGMELTTSEDIHLLCLFSELKAAEDFGKYTMSQMLKIVNNKHIFGNQIIYDENDNIVDEEQYLLIPSSNIPAYKASEILKQYGGVAMPAHIDREANGIISVLGGIDEYMGFNTIEFSSIESERKKMLKQKYSDYRQITNTDSHHLYSISETKYFMDLPDVSSKEIIKYFSQKNSAENTDGF